jgi:alkylation response protein AidB-like acyl-CoA dehydrogenase
MDTQGGELRPIKLLDGGYEVDEIFFTDVKVPVAGLVGEEGRGGTIAKYLLSHARTNIVGVGLSMIDHQLGDRFAQLNKVMAV